MMSDADQYDAIRKRVEKRYKAKQELIIHIASYVATNIGLWWFFGNIGGQWWLPWVTLGWGIGVVVNFFDYYNKYGGGVERREAEIQREIEREKERLGLYEKPKNESRVRLSEDGELEEIVDEDDYTSQQKRRG